MKIYAFGNEFLENDSLAKIIADKIDIPGIEIIKAVDPSEIFLEEDKIIILDVVENLKEVILIENIDELKANNMNSLHDFDLGYFLKLMKSMGQIKKVMIIGIPMKGDNEVILKEVISKINFILDPSSSQP